MAIGPPIAAEIEEIARDFGMHLDAEDVASFQELAAPFVLGTAALDALPDVPAFDSRDARSVGGFGFYTDCQHPTVSPGTFDSLWNPRGATHWTDVDRSRVERGNAVPRRARIRTQRVRRVGGPGSRGRTGTDSG